MNPLLSARSELEELLRQKSEIEKRIAAIEQTIKILEPVYANDFGRGLWGSVDAILDADAGLTDRIRDILRRAAPSYLSPTAVRDVLTNSGFDASGRSNFLAEVHNVLKRLTARNQLDEKSLPTGKIYRSLGNLERQIRGHNANTGFQTVQGLEQKNMGTSGIPDIPGPDEPHTGFKRRYGK